jgi:hypothetical protein
MYLFYYMYICTAFIYTFNYIIIMTWLFPHPLMYSVWFYGKWIKGLKDCDMHTVGLVSQHEKKALLGNG